MKAASVHGGGDVFASISVRFGLLGQYGPCAPFTLGIITLNGREGLYSSDDIGPSSSASQSHRDGGVFSESDEEVELLDIDEAFLVIITLLQKVLRVSPGVEALLRLCKPAEKFSWCRSCVCRDASLERVEGRTTSVSSY